MVTIETDLTGLHLRMRIKSSCSFLQGHGAPWFLLSCLRRGSPSSCGMASGTSAYWTVSRHPIFLPEETNQTQQSVTQSINNQSVSLSLSSTLSLQFTFGRDDKTFFKACDCTVVCTRPKMNSCLNCYCVHDKVRVCVCTQHEGLGSSFNCSVTSSPHLHPSFLAHGCLP